MPNSMLNTKKRVLVVGGTGFVGSSIVRSLRDHGNFEVAATDHRAYTPEQGVAYYSIQKLDDKDMARNIVQSFNPSVVVYAVGSNDLSKTEPDDQLKVTQLAHSIGATHFLNAADLVKAKFVYISSDYLFSGVEGNNYEDSIAIPASTLGKSKLGAENYVRSRSLNHIILRCSLLLGRGTLDHPSWIDQIRESAILGKKIKLPNKSIHNPVHISFLAEALIRIIEQDIKNKTFNIGGLSKVSLFECAQIVANHLKLEVSAIEPSDEASNAMPSDYSLNFTESLKELSMKPLLLEQSLELL